ncbi:hypothetical protein P691DRAFT_776987 [Macrolepiota fuliginosa MF-IS2]|uniref:Uncharacterized protein n=1 Tax=Macrolepiota fuliginosa MF-IS2 TaxID=1400762 RepID=A0A9P6BZH2_9AGAR|nr:hypothetical protein P691DRAFT_776987 [Macrolepiota fuliginosa MF-IS2]
MTSKHQEKATETTRPRLRVDTRNYPEASTSQNTFGVTDTHTTGIKPAPVALAYSARGPTPPPEYVEELPTNIPNITTNNNNNNNNTQSRPPAEEVTIPVLHHDTPHHHTFSNQTNPKEFEESEIEPPSNSSNPSRKKRSFWKTRTGFVILVILIAVIILGAVLGGVLGSRPKNNDNEKPTGNTHNTKSNAGSGVGGLNSSPTRAPTSTPTSTRLPGFPQGTSIAVIPPPASTTGTQPLVITGLGPVTGFVAGPTTTPVGGVLFTPGGSVA